MAGPGGDARCISTDVTRSEQVLRAIDETLALWGRLDALFNAAGISGRRFGDGPVADCSEEGWRTVIDANLTSIFLCRSMPSPPALLAAGGGSIVNLASVLGMVGGDELFATHAYAASKGGIIGLSRAMASYYAQQQIRVNVVAPGLIGPT